jgi:hypothetical protein
MTTRTIGRAAGLLAALILVAGCGDGPATGEVSGTVKVDGQVPAAGSSITFIPADGKSPTAGAVLGEDGRYQVEVPIGTARVEIRVPRPMGKRAPKAAGPGAEGGLIEESLPARYNDKSELTFEVKAGRNPKDWDVSAKP